MTRDKIITVAYLDNELRKTARVFSPHNWRDLLHIAIEILCVMPEHQLMDIHNRGKIRDYLFITMKWQTENPRTTYGKMFMQPMVNIDEIQITQTDNESPAFIFLPEFSDFIEFCKKVSTNTTDSYIKLCADATVIYYEYTPQKKRSYRDFAKQTGINQASICQYIKEMKSQFKKVYEDRITAQ